MGYPGSPAIVNAGWTLCVGAWVVLPDRRGASPRPSRPATRPLGRWRTHPEPCSTAVAPTEDRPSRPRRSVRRARSTRQAARAWRPHPRRLTAGTPWTAFRAAGRAGSGPAGRPRRTVGGLGPGPMVRPAAARAARVRPSDGIAGVARPTPPAPAAPEAPVADGPAHPWEDAAAAAAASRGGRFDDERESDPPAPGWARRRVHDSIDARLGGRGGRPGDARRDQPDAPRDARSLYRPTDTPRPGGRRRPWDPQPSEGDRVHDLRPAAPDRAGSHGQVPSAPVRRAWDDPAAHAGADTESRSGPAPARGGTAWEAPSPLRRPRRRDDQPTPPEEPRSWDDGPPTTGARRWDRGGPGTSDDGRPPTDETRSPGDRVTTSEPSEWRAEPTTES